MDTPKLQSPYSLDFSNTPFHKLMQRRVYRVLLICSSFDAFTLEEDGRIDEQIFNEYASLNLRYPPVFLQAHTPEQALGMLHEHRIELIIIMLNPGDLDAFGLAKNIKRAQPGIPMVILSHYSREVVAKLEGNDLVNIDHVFCWLGNADLLLAIIKLVEDRMNAFHDILEVGVQAIILYEDSVRAYSSLLPILYKMVMRQAQGFMLEGLNHHRQTLRMRGRPKILLVKSYSEAEALYNRFKPNIIGVISKTCFEQSPVQHPDSCQGVKLCRLVHADDPNIPFLLQSDLDSHAKFAQTLGVGFINKKSKTYTLDLRNYIAKHFGFGDLVFHDPVTQEEVARASNLQELQQVILTVPSQSLEYHSSLHHISKWLNARALFPIAKLFKQISLHDFDSIASARSYLHEAISAYRLSRGQGVIAQFQGKTFDHHVWFSRMGQGSIGGKARGLAFIDSPLKDHFHPERYPNSRVTIPRTVVISTEYYDEFIRSGNLLRYGISDRPDVEILEHFLASKLPNALIADLSVVVSEFTKPIAVRSSSILEDSRYQPFAGIYSTHLVPLASSKEIMLLNLQKAIKAVYASVFFRASKAYMAATSNIIDQEKLGVILQEVCGEQHGDLFFPTLSGVARSVNYYPVGSERPNEGVATVALGLGIHFTNGEVAIRFSPSNPSKILQLSQPDMALRQTQKVFYALRSAENRFAPTTGNGSNILRLPVAQAERIAAYPLIVSTLDPNSQTLRDGLHEDGVKLITLAGILKHKTFPLANILRDVLDIGQREMGCNVEIEFAASVSPPNVGPSVFHLLQIRPMVESEQHIDLQWDNLNKGDAIVHSQVALGHGRIQNISDIIYVDPVSFNPANTQTIAQEIEAVNSKYMDLKRNYILIGPGRWGSSDPWLGIPIRWVQISGARVIVEYSTESYKVEPSFGTHFFQSLTSFRIGYLTVNPALGQGILDHDYLSSIPPWLCTQHLRCINFSCPLRIIFDGREKHGVVFKPDCS